jgi:hypothetical protein
MSLFYRPAYVLMIAPVKLTVYEQKAGGHTTVSQHVQAAMCMKHFSSTAVTSVGSLAKHGSSANLEHQQCLVRGTKGHCPNLPYRL